MAASRPIVYATAKAPSGDMPRSWKNSDRSGAMSTQGLDSDAPSKLTEPIITASSGTVPGSGSSAARPDSGLRSHIPSVAPLERRDAREQVEVDRERLAALDPAIDAVERHRDERGGGVHERRDRDVLGQVAVRRGQLLPREAEDPDRGRPSPQSLRVGERRGQIAAAANQLREPRDARGRSRATG